MALFDTIVKKKTGYLGYTGNPPTTQSQYDKVKADMFEGTPPTWSTIKSEMDAYVDPRQSGISKLKAETWSPLTDDEAAALFGE
tara:strand:- start:74 stop:325 length:252 start_codon:yes stop_codon:yes gene_type:complete